MDENEDYVAFDDDAEEAVATEEDSKKGKKKRKMKVDREGSKKNSKKKGKLGKLAKFVIGGGIVLFVAVNIFGKPLIKNEPVQERGDEYYVCVASYVDNGKPISLDDYYVYNDSGSNWLVVPTGDEQLYSVSNDSIIETDEESDLTPLEGTELLEQIVHNSLAVEAEPVYHDLQKDGTAYSIYVAQSTLSSLLSDPNCIDSVSGYTDNSGVEHDNLSEFLDTFAEQKESSATK